MSLLNLSTPVITSQLRENEAVVDGWIVDATTGVKKYPVEMTVGGNTTSVAPTLPSSLIDSTSSRVPVFMLLLVAGLAIFFFFKR